MGPLDDVIILSGAVKHIRDGQGVIFQNNLVRIADIVAQHISPGYRAVAIKVDEVVGTGGFLQPGDHVDVIFTTQANKETYEKSLSRRILRNVRLLAFGTDVQHEAVVVADENGKSKSTSTDKESGKASRSAVLEIALEDTNKLILADKRGDLRLVAVGESDLLAEGDGEATQAAADDALADDPTYIRAVTGQKPPRAPQSVFVYSGDSVETVRVPK